MPSPSNRWSFELEAAISQFCELQFCNRRKKSLLIAFMSNLIKVPMKRQLGTLEMIVYCRSEDYGTSIVYFHTRQSTGFNLCVPILAVGRRIVA